MTPQVALKLPTYTMVQKDVCGGDARVKRETLLSVFFLHVPSYQVSVDQSL